MLTDAILLLLPPLLLPPLLLLLLQLFTSVRVLPKDWQPQGITRELKVPVDVVCGTTAASSSSRRKRTGG
jgi:hypothetical protein